MPRPLRIEYGGAIYHVINRGDRRENIFRDYEDRKCFLATLEEACRKTQWQVLAYCLMPNHFHLVVETPQPKLVAGMKWLLGVYSKRFNIRHQWCGHLFAGRYKALLVEGGGNGYRQTVCDYVHLNPVRAKMIRPAEPLEKFVWSSYGNYLKDPKERPRWLRVNRLLGGKRHSQGQRGRAAEIQAADGVAAARGETSGLCGPAAGVVRGQRRVPPGPVGGGRGRRQSQPLRKGPF